MSKIESLESTVRIENDNVSGSRTEAQSGALGDAVAPNPEVKPKIRRKYLTAEYKLRILSEADRLGRDSSRIAALLRREGLYASHLSSWRRMRAAGSLAALSQTRGRKPEHDAKDLQIEQLSKELDKLRAWKRQAEIVMDAQKKIALLLGNPIQEETLPKLPSLESSDGPNS
jgi:transposase